VLVHVHGDEASTSKIELRGGHDHVLEIRAERPFARERQGLDRLRRGVAHELDVLAVEGAGQPVVADARAIDLDVERHAGRRQPIARARQLVLLAGDRVSRNRSRLASERT
jgi:hypothetical protein